MFKSRERSLIAIAALFGMQSPAHSIDLQLSAKTEPTTIPNVFCVRLSAVNLSPNQSLTVAANKACATSGNVELKPLSATEVYALTTKAQRKEKKREQLVATVATAGLATLTVGDISDKKESKTAWLGKVNKRRNTTDTLFIDRVLLPLDHSDGLIYFLGTAPPALKLRIPSGVWPSDPAVPLTNQVIDVAAYSSP